MVRLTCRVVVVQQRIRIVLELAVRDDHWSAKNLEICANYRITSGDQRQGPILFTVPATVNFSDASRRPNLSLERRNRITRWLWLHHSPPA
jgi:hypothetical protein